ncbi:MAG: hypothetical protein JST39_23120 [Bacteroidetes bacterium]|nr:hypothetical protein [Bacteroidota bacterium]
MKKIKALSALNAVAFFVQICMTALVQMKLVNDFNVGEISDKYPSLFTPAGITFSIWGIIYIGLAVLCTYHIIMAWTRPATHPANIATERMGEWFIIVNLAAAFWLLSWVSEDIRLSVIFIFTQLIGLIIIHQRVGIYDNRLPASSRWLTQAPLSIYFGWITVAAIANTSSYLNLTEWDGWGLDPVDWTTILIGVTVFISLLVMTIRKNVFFGLVVIWALYGIILKRSESDGALYFHILRTAWIGISILVLVAIIRIIRNRVNLKAADAFPIAPHPMK